MENKKNILWPYALVAALGTTALFFLINLGLSPDLNAIVLKPSTSTIQQTAQPVTTPTLQVVPTTTTITDTSTTEVPVSEQPVMVITTETTVPDTGDSGSGTFVPPPPSEPAADTPSDSAVVTTPEPSATETSVTAPETASSTSGSNSTSTGSSGSSTATVTPASSSEPVDGFGGRGIPVTTVTESPAPATNYSAPARTSTYRSTTKPQTIVTERGREVAEEEPKDGFFLFDIDVDPYTEGLRGSSVDTDGEGLYDNLEYLYGTDPEKDDTDGDGFSDGREVLDYKTDPLDADDPGSLEAMGIKITGFDEGQEVADFQPLIKGVAPPGEEVEIWAQRINGENVHLGNAIGGDEYVFSFRPEQQLKEGEYDLSASIKEEQPEAEMAKSPLRTDLLNEGDDAKKIPRKIKIKVVKPDSIESPQPEKLSRELISEEMLLQNLRVEIEDDKPVLYGNVNFLYQVRATWNSIVMTSALIADSPAGEFEIEPPRRLYAGDHEIYVQAVRPKDNMLSEAVRIPFTIKEKTVPPAESPKPAAEEGVLPVDGGGSLWALWVGAVLLILALAYAVIKKSGAKKKGL